MELSLTQIASIATAYNQGRTDYSLSEVSFYANIAMQEVATRIQYRGLERTAYSSTTSGGNRMALPTDFDYMVSLSISSSSNPHWGGQLSITDPPLMDSIGTMVGVPRYYAVYSDWMELGPPPDSTYSLQMRYGAKISSLVSSTATPGLDSRYHYPIALKTAELLAAARNDLDQEAMNRSRYLDAIGSTPSDLAYRQRSREGMRAQIQKYQR